MLVLIANVLNNQLHLLLLLLLLLLLRSLPRTHSSQKKVSRKVGSISKQQIAMGVSIALVVVVAVSFLHIFAFVLAIGAEKRRSTGKVVPDEYDERTYCSYDSDASTAYGMAAFAVVLVSHTLVNGVTRCLCFGKGRGSGTRCCTITSFVVSWMSFLVAEICLIAGSARNAYHTKYVGYYAKKDLESCASLRKGVFAAAAAMLLISLAASLLYYWSYSKTDTGGWVKHQNEGVRMAEYGPDKGESGNSGA